MKHKREFEIAWKGLKPGVHEFVYDIDDAFMHEHHADEETKDWKASVTMKMDKKTDFFLLQFDISGSVSVPCDRCAEYFKLDLWDEFKLVIKLTGEDSTENEDEDDVVFIPRSETVIDISNWLYEFVMLSLPLQHIHPDKENGEGGCDPKVLKLLNHLSEPDEGVKNDIWKGLDALKGKKL
jgi:uncharacterized metal-binding protein YceD (DUF177 family)